MVNDNLDRLSRFQAVDAQWGLMTKAQAVQLPGLPALIKSVCHGSAARCDRNEGRHSPVAMLLRACGERLCIAAKFRLMSVISPGAVSAPVYLSDQHADAPILHPGARFEQ